MQLIGVNQKTRELQVLLASFRLASRLSLHVDRRSVPTVSTPHAEYRMLRSTTIQCDPSPFTRRNIPQREILADSPRCWKLANREAAM